MKKVLLSLVLVGVMSSFAAAIPIVVQPLISSLNGQPIDPVTEITVQPSDVVNFDLVLTGIPATAAAKALALDLVVLIVSGPATLDISQLTFPPIVDMTLTPPPAWREQGKSAIVGASNFNGISDGIVIDHFLLHCDGLGDVVIEAIGGAANGGSFDTLGGALDLGVGRAIVHQIPEPFTLSLLGLGGLALLRRRQA